MPYQCSICNKAYSTASHLARHRIAHQPARHFQCSFCTKSFARQDIARRHSQRCSKRQGQPVVEFHGRGQPRKACDRCASAKIACDKTKPCAACSKIGSQCSYSRLQSYLSNQSTTNTSHHPLVDPEELPHGSNRNKSGQSAATKAQKDMAEPAAEGSRVPFLLSYTAAGTGDPKDFTDALETLKDSNKTAISDEESDAEQVPLHGFPILVPFFAAEMYQYDIPHGPLGVSDLTREGQHVSDMHGEIFRRRVADLFAFVECVGRTADSPSPDTVGMLLTSSNLALCVESFFQYAYRHVPIVHEPSFKVESVELPLLLSVFVVGAVWSYPRDTYFMVLDMVDMFERCIFHGDILQKLQEQASSNPTRTTPHVLALLQAATMLVSISFAFPDPNLRRRFRDQRFSELVSIARLLQGDGTKSNSPSIADAPGSDYWMGYITRETYNRVIYYIYLLDCHISMMHATLPRFSVLEMKACLPSDESIFGAKDTETYRDRLLSLGSPQTLSLVEVVQCLMATDPICPKFLKLTAFPLFLAIEAIQTMIFTSKVQLIEMSEIARFERALTRWKEVWVHSQKAHASLEQNGFMVHAEEVWLLAHKILKSDTSKLISKFGVNDMTQVRRWLTDLD